MVNPRWYRGPWLWDTSSGSPHWRSPDGAVGCLDLRSIPEQAQAGGAPGLGIFLLDGDSLDSSYDLLGTGGHRDVKISQTIMDRLPKKRGHAIEGDDLLGAIWSIMTTGADPEGLEFCKPILPTVHGRLELHVPGMRFHAEGFEWGRSKETSVIKTLLRKEFAGLLDDARKGKLKDADHHRRVLDYWCDKYRVDDWREFVPTKDQKDVPGRLKHETTISESFDTADSTTLGPDLTWSEVVSDWTIISNKAATPTGAGSQAAARAQSDLSSADHWAEVDVTWASTASDMAGAAARFASGATTYYRGVGSALSDTDRIDKVVAGVRTNLASQSHTIGAETLACRCTANGSSIRVDVGANNMSVTDSSITGNLRTGMAGTLRNTAGQNHAFDAFHAEDISVSTIIYTQLERRPGGVERGTYHRNG